MHAISHITDSHVHKLLCALFCSHRLTFHKLTIHRTVILFVLQLGQVKLIKLSIKHMPCQPSVHHDINRSTTSVASFQHRNWLGHLPACRFAGWAAPTGLEQYQLEAKHARPLSSMRATYMIQLLVDLCAKTAKSTTWANLFARLDERETQSSLVTLDSCSINGLQEFCSMWSEALECLARSSAANPVDLPAILAKAEVKPMTKEAIKLSGKTSSTNPDDAAAEDNAESPSVFSVKELAEFGQSDLVPAADQLFQLRWMISAKLIEAARTPNQTTKRFQTTSTRFSWLGNHQFIKLHSIIFKTPIQIYSLCYIEFRINKLTWIKRCPLSTCSRNTWCSMCKASSRCTLHTHSTKKHCDRSCYWLQYSDCSQHSALSTDSIDCSGARTTTDANWDKLSLNITTSESKGKSTDAASLDVEILYQLTAADEIMVSPVDENVRYWKATNLTLVFFGDIGNLPLIQNWILTYFINKFNIRLRQELRQDTQWAHHQNSSDVWDVMVCYDWYGPWYDYRIVDSTMHVIRVRLEFIFHIIIISSPSSKTHIGPFTTAVLIHRSTGWRWVHWWECERTCGKGGCATMPAETGHQHPIGTSLPIPNEWWKCFLRWGGCDQTGQM